MAYSVYILELEDGSYYIGHTNNLRRRLKEHSEARACSHTKKIRMVKLLWFEDFDDRLIASKREKELKGWRREKKEKLWKSVGSS